MRDFEQDRLQAATFTGEMKASDFSWSIERHELFRACERAYFIRYYLAQGGWDRYASEQAKSAYQEKYLSTYDQWLTRTFRETMFSALKKTATCDPKRKKKDFSFQFLRGLSRAVSDLQYSLDNREYESDPKKPVLLEYLRRFPSFDDTSTITRNAVAVFSNAYAALIHSDLFREIISLEFMDLRLDDPFLSFDFETYPVWFSPGLVYFLKDTVSMLQCLADTAVLPHQATSERMRLTASLFELYIRGKWKRHAISSLSCTFSADTVSLQYTPPTTNIRPLIRKSAGKMLAKITPDATVRLNDFAVCANPETCRFCQFTGTCRALKDFHPA